MTFKPQSGLIALFLAVFCAFAAPSASAQTAGRDNVFAVSGVAVDETASNAADAQESAFAQGRRLAFERLVRRLTIPEELAGRGLPAPDATALDRLVLSVDVSEERRSSTRYIGRMTVRFDPSSMRTLLRGQGLSVVETRTSPMLVVPVSPRNWPGDDQSALWRETWEQGGYQSELVPMAVAPPNLTGAPNWDAAAPYASAEGATTALYAGLSIQGGTLSATLVEVGANGARRDRGTVTAQLNGSDAAAYRAAFSSLADQANARVQSEWKVRVATGSGQRARVSASALYRDEGQWEVIKDALEAAAQTLISEIRIEAVGREGALVSFSFVGDRNQLNAEFASHGVRLDDSAIGPVLRVAGN